MDFKKTAMGMLAAAVAASPVVVAQGNSAHGNAHGGTATHSGPLFTGILCTNNSDSGDSSDEISVFSEFFNQHGHEFWAGGGNASDDSNGSGWRMQTNNIHPSTWQVDMQLYTVSDGEDYGGVDTSSFFWFLNNANGGHFVGEYIDLDTISNSEPTCVTASSLSNGFTRYKYNAHNDPGVGSGTTYGSGVYFMDFGPEDDTAWEDLATNPLIAGHGAIPDLHNTPSFDCNEEFTDSNVGS